MKTKLYALWYHVYQNAPPQRIIVGSYAICKAEKNKREKLRTAKDYYTIKEA